MVRASLIASAALMVCACIPAGAAAQSQRTDPDASSPAGVIYEIPFDNARKDSAPMANGQRGGGGSGGTGTTGSGSGSNGSGSSGSSAAGGSDGSSSSSAGGSDGSGTDGTGAGGASGGASSPNVGTSIHSENGFGSSSQVPGVGTVAQTQEDAIRQAGGGGNSSTATFGLLAIVLAVGTWVGVVTSRSLRDRD